MSWEEGKFSVRSNKPGINKELMQVKGQLDEQDAK
jgi:hypothetical protein